MKSKEKKCIYCEGRLRKHGIKRWLREGVEMHVQDYECSVCGRRSVHWKGKVIPRKVY